MALRLCDGFDSYADADKYLRWTSRLGNLGAVSVGSTARTGAHGLHLAADNNLQSTTAIYKQLDAQPTWVLGAAFRVAAFASSFTILAVLDSGTTQVDVRMNGSGQLYVTRNGTALGSASAQSLVLGTWAYVELKTTIHPTAGAATVRVNGVAWIALTGQDTQASGNASANQVALGGTLAAGSAGDLDDFYACDAAGAANNDFLGDVKVVAVLPSGAGTYGQLSPVGAASNYQCVNQATEDGDTTYVSGATAGQKDSYATGSLAGAGAVKGVQLTLVARKDDAGTRTVAPLVRQGATDALGAAVGLGTSYQQYLQVYDTNPATGAAWSWSDLGQAEFGMSVQS